MTAVTSLVFTLNNGGFIFKIPFKYVPKKKLKKKSSIPPQQAFLLIVMFSFHIGERAFRRAGQSYAKTGSQELLIP